MMAERVVASGWLSNETTFTLVVDGPYDVSTVSHLIEHLKLQKGWLSEPAIHGEMELASWLPNPSHGTPPR